MKKLVAVTLLLGALVAIAHAAGIRCIFCNGTGFQGNYNCGHCRGTGRVAY